MVCLIAIIFFFAWPSWGYHVLLDPGHGGKDKGAVVPPYKESHLALQVAQILYQLLSDDTDFSVIMTRSDNRFVPLTKRVHLGNQKKVDIFISIHANASPSAKVRGAEIYFKNQLPIDKEALIHANHEQIDPMDKSFPRKIHRQGELKHEVVDIIRDLKRNHNLWLSGELSKALFESWKVPGSQIKILQAPFFVISHNHMPSILIELGFLTNKKEAQLLYQKKYQTQLARSIYEGLKKYKINDVSSH